MDTELSSSIILFSSLIFLAFLWNVITRSKLPRSSSKLPPGPRKLPFIGSLHHLIKSRPPHHILTNLASKYGPLMHLQLGEVSAIVVSSPEAAKAVMNTHDVNFSNRPSLFASKVILYENSNVAFAPYGEYWRQLRKFYTIELLSPKRVQSFRPLREEVFMNMCSSIASKEGCSLDMSEKLSLITCDLILRAALGNTSIDEHSALVSIVIEAFAIIGEFNLGDLYPSISLFKGIGGYKGRLEKLRKYMDTLLDKIINARRATKSQDQEEETFIDVLLNFHKDTGHEFQLSDDNIKAVLVDIFVGGIETSSATAEWAMAEMMRHPIVLKKAQDEVRRVFGDKGFVDESDFDELKYLKLVIKETLRIHPPGPLLLPRESSEACEINGYTIPAKTRTMVNVWAIGRDPKIWKDAESFIPERFLDKDISVDYTGKGFKFMPFGAGRRMCPGMAFGLANVEVPLAMLLYHFDWVLPQGIKPEDLDMGEAIALSGRKKTPLYVIPKLKNPLPLK
ncbi:cytochrome P450 71D9-like [Andrographis paniculata]|uniref:cytochrome P450 71D9-like n=1 Tax=Andrographis paniculata TaxID=175694 RepID=UPI0021E8B974|nr:cytochrome P450 71D9-like [Andrographis paniculata]